MFSTNFKILSETLNSLDCRVVYVARNPKDTLISLWHFQNSIYLGQKWEPQPLEDVVSKFCEGVVVDGPYFEHVLGYHKESLERPEKFFFITYEELKSDPNIHVKRLAEFLGCPFVGEDMEEQVEEVVRSCSIETLKKHDMNNSSDVPSWSRDLSTHIPYQILGRAVNSSDCWVVYVARNPKDTLISCWHFVNSINGSKSSAQALEDVVDKFSEESNPNNHVMRLIEFLRCALEGEDAEEQVEEVVRSCSTVTLKNQEVNKSIDVPSWSMVSYDAFFRKG
ncbi:hypothetical protein RHSIM_Rhsim10G0058600 [Rhododendron simsii]|uniref:Sulfotransferase n=1 Tax=Rhododendron simsii TaxID=118357 RepID=A0A834LDU4_RHOSS|nr:hypothetical protein RHSIM_Rhsim10G0058600 [Rhododendron simsii]